MILKTKSLLLTALVFVVLTLSGFTVAKGQDIITGERIYGDNRYNTSINISKLGWPDGSETAIIATGKDFPDALSSAPLAKKYNAPILLTQNPELSKNLVNELARLKVKKVYIIGGTGVVSQTIQNSLSNQGIECKRLYGSDRYGTSAAVAKEIGPTTQVVIATGVNFPDALSIAPWAASNGIPILLTETNKVPKPTKEYIKSNNVTKAYIIGGIGVVGNPVLEQLPQNSERIEGENRFETNAAVLNRFGQEFNYDKTYVATGNNFPDALSGSAIAAISKSPIILSNLGSITSTKNYMNSISDKLNEVYILGGTSVISDKAIEGVMPPLVADIDIEFPVSSIGINKQTKAIANITMIPENAKKPEVVFYSIDDNSIARVDSDGTITGIQEGYANIIAKINEKAATKKVAVRDKKIIVLDPGHGGYQSGAVPQGKVEYRESVLNMEISQKLRSKLIDSGFEVVMTREGDNYVTLDDRAKIANDLMADLFISIHHDASTASASGTSAFYSDYKPGIDNDGVYARATGNGTVKDENGYVLGKLVSGQTYSYVREVNGDIYIMFNGKIGKTNLYDVMVYDSTPSLASIESKKIAQRINVEIGSLGIIPRGVADKNFAVTRLANVPAVLVEVGFISNPYEFERIRQDSFQEQVGDKIKQVLVDYFEDK